jgi:phenylacetate-CoA ligase
MHDRSLEAWCAAKIGREGSRVENAELAAYQLRRLTETLYLARAKSPFYRRHLAAAPEELAGIQDLQTLPFTTAQDIRAHGLQFLCVSQDAIRRVVTLDSSGTTGSPKRIYFTQADQELTIDFFRAGMATFTSPGDRVLILLPGETPGSVGDLLAIALERMGAEPVKHGLVRDVGETLRVMRQEQVDGVVGVPYQVHALAAYGPGLQLKHALLTTDHVPDAIVTAVAKAWGCAVYNHYGMTEMGLGGGVACAAHRGYHLREADLLFEIVDPVTGLAVPDGMYGEVVFTTLTRAGMPLIRYRTGDLSRFVPGACACGTRLLTLERVRGRVGGAVSIGGAELRLAELDEALFAIPGVLTFSAAVTNDRSDCLELEVRTVEGGGSAVAAAVDAALAGLPAVAAARTQGRLDMAVTVLQTGYVLSGAPKRAIVHQLYQGNLAHSAIEITGKNPL